MKLVHSFHYFENKVKLENNKIVDTKTGEVIQILSNFYRDKNIFNAKIERVLNKKKSLQNYKRFFRDKSVKYNICYNNKVIIDVNLNNLVKSLKENHFYDRKNFFLLLSRNFGNANVFNLDSPLDQFVNKNPEYKDTIDFNYFSKNIIKFDKLYFDLELERIYFDENDIVRNREKVFLRNTSVIFTHNDKTIENLFRDHDVFNNLNQNIILYRKSETHVDMIKKAYNISNSIVIDSDNMASLTYSEIINKTIFISYETIINKYKYNILINTDEYKDTDECLENLKERYIYETSFMKRDNFLNLSCVILHSLTYDNLIVLDFDLNCNRYMDNILLKKFIFKKSYFVSNKFLEYKVNTFLDKLKHFYDLNLDLTKLSLSFINNLLRSTYIDDYSNIKKEKSIIYNYSRSEETVINKIDYSKKSEKLSLPLLFQLQKSTQDDIKHISTNECPICYEKLTPNNTIKTSCNHYFCQNCIGKQLNNEKSLSCSLCRKKLDKDKDIGQLVQKIKTVPGKMGKIFQNLTNNSIVISEYNENLKILSRILQNWKEEYGDVLLVNKNCINNKDLIGQRNLLFLENNVEKSTRHLFKNSEIKVLVPVKEPA